MLTITPGRSFIDARHAAADQNSGPRRLVWNVLSKRGSSTPRVNPKYGFAAALLTRMSRLP